MIANTSKVIQLKKLVDWYLLKLIKDSSSIFDKHVIVELYICGWGMGGQHPL